jgi:hypothetical protein
MKTLADLLIALLALTIAIAPGTALAQSCNREPKCTQIRTCQEADFYFRQCGHHKRDGDSDGIPCEDLCGKTLDEYYRRRE